MGSTFAVNILSEFVCQISYRASKDFAMIAPIINFLCLLHTSVKTWTVNVANK